jgi:signal transduction histidine kinase
MGVVLTTVDMTETVYPLIASWPGRGDTGDIRLVGQQAGTLRLLTPPIIESQIQLFQTLIFQEPEIMPAYLATQGQEGLKNAVDLDNRQVLAAYRHIPDTGWGFIVLKGLDEIMAPVRTLAQRLVVIGLFIFVLTALVSLALSRTLIQPLNRLGKATQAVAAGNLDVDLDIAQTDELGALADSFHIMVHALDSRQRQVQALTEGLEQQVAERTRELAEANAQLTKLDALKSKFVSNVSHELRTPVTNLKLYLNMLERQTDEQRARSIQVLKGQADVLAQLIEDILNLSRLESRDGHLVLSPVDLNALTAEVVQAHLPQAERKGLRLTLDAAPDLPTIQADQKQLRQVLTNLTANAINYTPAGSVQIRTFTDLNRVVWEVADTGMGINEEDLAHLFERFYRGQRMIQSAIPGTGLGLGIVKEIVNLHEGSIDVESVVDQGTVMRVRLCIDGPTHTTIHHVSGSTEGASAGESEGRSENITGQKTVEKVAGAPVQPKPLIPADS